MEKKGSANRVFMIMSILSILALGVAFLWNQIPIIKNSVSYILNPTFGKIINWNLTWGSIIVFFILAVITTLIQKFGTDQETLRELKKEQKKDQEEIKKYRDDPKKFLELQKKSGPTTWRIMEISMKSSVFTIIPFVLLFRWFMDFFAQAGSPKFFGLLSWFWFYLISVIVFNIILKKVFKVE